MATQGWRALSGREVHLARPGSVPVTRVMQPQVNVAFSRNVVRRVGEQVLRLRASCRPGSRVPHAVRGGPPAQTTVQVRVGAAGRRGGRPGSTAANPRAVPPALPSPRHPDTSAPDTSTPGHHRACGPAAAQSGLAGTKRQVDLPDRVIGGAAPALGCMTERTSTGTIRRPRKSRVWPGPVRPPRHRVLPRSRWTAGHRGGLGRGAPRGPGPSRGGRGRVRQLTDKVAKSTNGDQRAGRLTGLRTSGWWKSCPPLGW